LQYDNGVFRQSDRPLEEKEFPDEIDLAEGDEDSPLTLRHCPACSIISLLEIFGWLNPLD
jgi:hypothetical protein